MVSLCFSLMKLMREIDDSAAVKGEMTRRGDERT